MRVYLETLGCRLNYAEMAALGRELAGAGHHVVGSAAEADVCVLNSCAVTGEAARKSRQLARQLARANPVARVVVTGCYATLEGEKVAGLPNVTLVVGNDRKDKLAHLLTQQKESLPERTMQESSPEPIKPEGVSVSLQGAPAAGRTRAFVKVQDGCHNRCAFCIVTVARGEERSRAIGDVTAEINSLHAAGYQEAVVTGVHLGAYGRDLGTSLHALVHALLENTSIPRLRLSSLEPFDLVSTFFDLWAESDGRLMPHLHLPAQSGSDAVLRRMARRNRVADFEALVAAARARISGLVVTTDLIAGFPGETVEDFAETIDFARRVGFGHMHAFPYSARTGTAAARMNGQVPEAERRARTRVLNELDRELGQRVRSALLGSSRTVLWENPVAGKGATNGTVSWEGLTDNYLRVRTATDAGQNLHNCVISTRITGTQGNVLWGEVKGRT